MRDSQPASGYGPVDSWRLGRSLGIDVLCVDSICSFECVYCQLGKINRVTSTREIFVPTAKVLADLDAADWQSADVITFSGSGEPTLAKNLGEIIRRIIGKTGKPIIVLTNSTLLNLPEVRSELARAERIFCKLDAWSEVTLKRIDRPAQGISLDTIISGIIRLRSEFKGFLAIQTMVLRAPKAAEIRKFAEILEAIQPDEVQLNVPTRPVPSRYFLETRGNDVKMNPDFRKLKTISPEELTKLGERLSELTHVPIITR